ncbi:hypothetical protein AKJ54_00310 [candidate division MSBL1 archaeon SCGC-AAA382K21]|uniref:Mevalonate kinase n=1 Tax=candidate division MSBL1 archaeon SCGC-AAA382K21 TaxID=1698283 RepID=A0A133VLR3_9EURY|nr:hypothetical protein AKJ54_00310 [candidate division MSBL1 archaeon SCGC-AAA382K21]
MKRIIRVSAPGQIFLFGEHAVVYGQPALAAAINISTEAKAKPRADDQIKIVSKGVGNLKGKVKKTNGDWSIQEKTGELSRLRFVVKTAEITLNHLDEGSGFELEIDSEVPVGSGLGSSSAVTTATAAAISSIFDRNLSKDDISDLAYDAELKVQGAASKTGVKVATHGGFLKVTGDEMNSISDISELKVLIGNTGDYGNTGELVKKVRLSKESRPEIINPIIEAIGKTTEAGIKSLQDENLEKVGVLMNVNQNLLEGLGVSSPKLRKLIKAARDAGGKGAKITGAGGGGCMVALTEESVDRISRAIEKKGGEPIKVKVGVEGLSFDSK